MSDTLANLVTRVLYVGGEWLYVILATETDFFGVRFSNNESNPNPRFATVPASDYASNIEHPLTVVPWWPGMVAAFLSDAASGPRISGDQDTDQAYRRGVADGEASATAKFEAWKSHATEVAHEYADNNDLCSEFDRCMREIGLPDRGPKSYLLTFRVELERGTDPYDVVPVVDEYTSGDVEDWSRVNVESAD